MYKYVLVQTGTRQYEPGGRDSSCAACSLSSSSSRAGSNVLVPSDVWQIFLKAPSQFAQSARPDPGPIPGPVPCY